MRILLLLLLTSQLTAQLINPSFEQWQAVPSTYGAEDPVGWSSNNRVADSLNGYPIQKSTVAHSGNYALEIRPDYRSQNLGYINLGQISIDSLGQDQFQVSRKCSGVGITQLPFILSGYYQYLSPNQIERKVTISVGATPYACSDYVFPVFGHEIFTSTTDSIPTVFGYRPFAIPLSIEAYLDSIPFPDTLQIMISYEDPLATVNPGSLFLVDDLRLHGSLDATENHLQPDALSLYPNPARDYLQWELKDGTTIKTMHLYSSTGAFLQEIPLNTLRLDLKDFESGLYMLLVETELGWIREKFVVERGF